jgi:hypothetical protein
MQEHHGDALRSLLGMEEIECERSAPGNLYPSVRTIRHPASRTRRYPALSAGTIRLRLIFPF